MISRSLFGLAILLIVFVPVHAIENVEKLSAKGSLSKIGQSLAFDIGKHPLGTKIELSLAIQNNTGHNLHLKLSASCGCTEIRPSELSVKNGEFFELHPKISFPREAKPLKIAIKCEDANLETVFKIVVQGESKSHFEVSPGKIRVRSNVSEAVEVRLLKNFESDRILGIKLADGSPFDLKSVEGLDIRLQSRKVLEGVLDDTIILKVVDGNGDEESLAIPVEYLGNARLLPSIVTLRKADADFTAILLLYGVATELENDALEVAIGFGEKWSLKGKIVQQKRRSERGVTLVAKFPASEVEELFSSERKTLNIRVSAKSGEWSCVSSISSD